MSIFRDFLYYDARTIDSYLSAAEGGLYDEEDRRTTVDSAGVTPAGEHVSSSSLTSSDSRARTVRQTPAARFDRLVRFIESDGKVKSFRSGDTPDLDSFEDEEFYQIKGVIEISPFVNAVMNASKYQAVGNLVRELSNLGLTQMKNEQVVDQLEVMSNAREALGDKVSVVLSLGKSAPRFILPLRADLVEERFNELEGRVTVFGRLADSIPRSGQYTLIEVPGLPALSRQQRRQAEKSNDPNAPIVRGPLVVLHVLAVYR